jgi:hypothetical protein
MRTLLKSGFFSLGRVISQIRLFRKATVRLVPAVLDAVRHEAHTAAEFLGRHPWCFCRSHSRLPPLNPAARIERRATKAELRDSYVLFQNCMA